MEVKPGYKQTEVGAIPEDWGDPQLAEIAKDDSPICYGIVQVGSYARNGIPVLAIKNLNSDYVTNIHRASVEIERPYARSRIRPDDVVISVKGTTGRVGIVPTGFHGNISRDLARLRLREGTVPKFCFQMLQSDLAQRRLAVAVVGTTRMELSIAILKQVRIPLPPTKAEQEAIAEALSDADALIESLEQLITKKHHLKQGAMQELLSGKRSLHGLPGAKIGYKQTEVGVIPQHWDVDQIENLAQITTGGKNTQDRVEDGRHPFFVRSQTIERINSYSYDGEAVLTAGDGVGTGKVFHYIKGKFDVHQRVYRISDFNPRINGYFFFLYFSSRFYNRIMQMTAKSSVDSVRREMIAKMLVPLPPKAEQEVVAEALSDMDAEIAALEAKWTKARQLKQGMMQELLTGKTRLV